MTAAMADGNDAVKQHPDKKPTDPLPADRVNISPLLNRIANPTPANPLPSAVEMARAVSLIFTNQLSQIQTAALLTLLHTTGLDRTAPVIAACSACMRDAASRIDMAALARSVAEHPTAGGARGTYRGGLCDIVGTGGDGHSTFNVSTTSALLASSQLLVAKHGARASSSNSGSADVLQALRPRAPVIEAATAERVPALFRAGRFAFLFAPVFHPGMRHAAPVRKELGIRTIFNLLGPLSNPAHALIEARVLGVARSDLGTVFAEALRMGGAKKALVVCGKEELDEISCAGPTYCWQLREETEGGEVAVDEFELCPADFGLPEHTLDEVRPGKGPDDNAELLMRLMRGELNDDDPVLHFVLINTAALLTIAGVCEDDSGQGTLKDGEKAEEVVVKERGPGGQRWKEGVRRARWAVQSGEALKALQGYIEFTRNV